MHFRESKERLQEFLDCQKLGLKVEDLEEGKAYLINWDSELAIMEYLGVELDEITDDIMYCTHIINSSDLIGCKIVKKV